MTPPRLLVHTSFQSVRWGDMDALGHVNNTLYFRFMEQARSEWVYSLVEGGGQSDDQGSVLVNASCDYLAPIVFPSAIEVRMYLGDLGRTSVGSFYEIWTGERKCADGAAKIVWVRLSTGRPIPLPDSIAAPLRALGT
jgi:acyl-CoA thioester hydrolase